MMTVECFPSCYSVVEHKECSNMIWTTPPTKELLSCSLKDAIRHRKLTWVKGLGNVCTWGLAIPTAVLAVIDTCLSEVSGTIFCLPGNSTADVTLLWSCASDGGISSLQQSDRSSSVSPMNSPLSLKLRTGLCCGGGGRAPLYTTCKEREPQLVSSEWPHL